MTPAPAITRAIEELGLGSRILAMSPMGGGCIADVRRLELDSGHVVVAKCAADQGRLQEEADGLRALGSTGTVPVPEVLALVEGALLLEHLAPAVGGSGSGVSVAPSSSRVLAGAPWGGGGGGGARGPGGGGGAAARGLRTA